jgi:predicted transport protein
VATSWACPKCARRFTRKSQRHACGTGERADVLRSRPPAIVELYGALEAFARTLGPVEIVTRDRYVLLRSTRVFADLVITTGAVGLAIHLPRKVQDLQFVKVVADRRHVTHVVLLRTISELEAMKPLLREAYESSLT